MFPLQCLKKFFLLEKCSKVERIVKWASVYAPSSLNSYSAYGQSHFTHNPLPALSCPFEDYFGVCPKKPFLPSVTILVYDAKLCRLFVNCCSLLGPPSQNTAIWVASRTDPYPLTVPGGPEFKFEVWATSPGELLSQACRWRSSPCLVCPSVCVCLSLSVPSSPHEDTSQAGLELNPNDTVLT